MSQSPTVTTDHISAASVSSRSSYEPLSIQDRVFLALEKPGAHMHVTATCLFEGGPLVGADGGVDLHRLREHFMSSLATFPRYRQRLALVPLDRTPVWVDDERFDLDYHLRYARLPKAADDTSLKRLCSELVSRPLERDRPLWEVWVVEGLKRRRFALVTKVHHAVADGVAGMDLLASLLQTAGDVAKALPEPRPAPTPVELLRAETLRRALVPWSWLLQTTAAFASPSESVSRVTRAAFAMWDALGAGLRRAPATPLNQPIGSERRFDWLTMELDAVKEVKNRLGGTVNDVILAVVAGALRRFLERRRVRVDDLRALVPVNLRTPSQGDAKGNHVTAWLVDLPLCERDPLRRYARIRHSTERLRSSTRAVEGDALTGAAMWALQFVSSLVGALRPFNLVVTNVPGPSTTLDLLGARLVHAYPQAPLLSGQCLGIALFSYAGTLCWGFNADYDLLPDLDHFTEDVAASFEELSLATELLGKARERRLEVVTTPHSADGSTAAAIPRRASAYRRNERRRSVAAS
jgi:WS/DGAT/MGAT family acyltransferase